MKTTQIRILIFFLSISSVFTLDFDLEKITLPYDSLVIQDISVYNETILCRAENKVYRSEDDGISWEIVFDAPRKINHFYSLNAHTMFVVGDSGMVYRSMDYGNNWIDLSIDTEKNLTRIAAKDYSDCLVITANRFVFHKEKFNTDWIAYDTFSDKYGLLSIVYVEGKYFFGGRSAFIGTHQSHGGGSYDEYEFHAFNLENRKISSYQIESGIDGTSDSLKLFNINNRLYSSAVNGNNNFLTFSKSWDSNFSRMLGFYIGTYRFVKPFKIGRDLHIFIKSGTIYSFPEDTLKPYSDTMWGFKANSIELNIGITNDVAMSKDSLFYLASNNSNIYKVKLKETKTSVEYEGKSRLISQYGNMIQFSPEVDEFSIYNYLGEQIAAPSQLNQISLKNGIYIVVYKYRNSSYTKKIIVGY
ncbi:MAG: T9SS type A sorting domain-containing protein [Candidatus Kapaibacterium sp.]